MARRFESDDFERPDADNLAFTRWYALVFGRRILGDVNLRPGPLRELDVAGDKIRMGMCFENGDNFEFFARGRIYVIINIALGVDYDRFTAFANEVGSVRQPFYIESSLEHNFGAGIK